MAFKDTIQFGRRAVYQKPEAKKIFIEDEAHIRLVSLDNSKDGETGSSKNIKINSKSGLAFDSCGKGSEIINGSKIRDDIVSDVPSLFQSTDDECKLLTPSWKEKLKTDFKKENGSSSVDLVVTTSVEETMTGVKMIQENKGDRVFENQDEMDNSGIKENMKRKDLRNANGEEMECNGLSDINEFEEDDCNIDDMESNGVNRMTDIGRGLIRDNRCEMNKGNERSLVDEHKIRTVELDKKNGIVSINVGDSDYTSTLVDETKKPSDESEVKVATDGVRATDELLRSIVINESECQVIVDKSDKPSEDLASQVAAIWQGKNVESEMVSAPLSQVEGCLHIEKIDIRKWPKRKKPFVVCLEKHTGIGNLFVKNLTVDIEVGKLIAVFGVFGRIISRKIAKSDDGKSKSFGYVQFDSEESVVEALNDAEIGFKKWFEHYGVGRAGKWVHKWCHTDPSKQQVAHLKFDMWKQPRRKKKRRRLKCISEATNCDKAFLTVVDSQDMLDRRITRKGTKGDLNVEIQRVKWQHADATWNHKLILEDKYHLKGNGLIYGRKSNNFSIQNVEGGREGVKFVVVSVPGSIQKKKEVMANVCGCSNEMVMHQGLIGCILAIFEEMGQEIVNSVLLMQPCGQGSLRGIE
ncbi:polyadenylate-binding protein 7 [Artemisia annua]|uniref:Polyadenylate-binding protein 7 n=1 Tax=Artemisia annua TaxID=35608 RepID=A0A2U1LC21_ARTAN|nr:polyadenylate-binding protein 7 [Artemisia annua]